MSSLQTKSLRGSRADRGLQTPGVYMRLDAEAAHFLNLRRLPGRITSEQAATLLGVSLDSIPILIRYKFLDPLGKDIQSNAPKQFAAVRVLALAESEPEMHRMQTILTRFWRQKNDAKNSGGLAD